MNLRPRWGRVRFPQRINLRTPFLFCLLLEESTLGSALFVTGGTNHQTSGTVSPDGPHKPPEQSLPTDPTNPRSGLSRRTPQTPAVSPDGPTRSLRGGRVEEPDPPTSGRFEVVRYTSIRHVKRHIELSNDFINYKI